VVAICSGIAGLALVGVRALEAFRAFRSVSERTGTALRDLSAKAELTAATAEKAADTSELQESVARLRGALAQLAVLKAALEKADQQLGWVRVLL
jgi:hypothetical protein